MEADNKSQILPLADEINLDIDTEAVEITHKEIAIHVNGLNEPIS